MDYMIGDYLIEKESREKRIQSFNDRVQIYMAACSKMLIDQLVEERHSRNMTQQELADIMGIMPSNLARFESGTRVPTLIMLEKYAAALGKHIELKVCDSESTE